MPDTYDDNILRINANEIVGFRTSEIDFRVPMLSNNESTASVRTVLIDHDYEFKGLCIEGTNMTVEVILDLSSGIEYEVITPLT
jgi:hypothetical protein